MFDCLMDREWKNDYTCHDFACDAWRLVKNKELDFKKVKKLKKPKSPCIVYLSSSDDLTHVGVFFEDKVIHLSHSGVQYIPLEYLTIGFKKVEFYQ